MRWLKLVRGELRKLTTTSMPWAFVAVLVVIAAINAAAIIPAPTPTEAKTS